LALVELNSFLLAYVQGGWVVVVVVYPLEFYTRVRVRVRVGPSGTGFILLAYVQGWVGIRSRISSRVLHEGLG